jgi:hypothetical protein
MSQSKGARGGAAAKGKKAGKPGAEEKREDALQAVACSSNALHVLDILHTANTM